MKVYFKPGNASGTITVPPSKSDAHRLLIGASLAKGTSVIRGIPDGEDVSATLDCLRALGAKAVLQGNTATITGRIPENRTIPVLPCRESGSTLRFLIPVALTESEGAMFRGSARLMERGADEYAEALSEHGIRMEKTNTSIICRGKMTPGRYRIRGNVSSQYASGLLFALSCLEEDSKLEILPPVESRGYIRMTLSTLAKFGIAVGEIAPYHYCVRGGQSFRSIEASVEGDWSNGAALLAWNVLGGDVRVKGLPDETEQGDRVCESYFELLRCGDADIDIRNCPDLAPVLFAAAAANHGGFFTGTRRLRIKESDRAEAMTCELEKMGVRSAVTENSVRIYGGGLRRPREMLAGHNDHRIVMALSLLLAQTGGELDGAEAVRKSYPNYFEDLKKLGISLEYKKGIAE